MLFLKNEPVKFLSCLLIIFLSIFVITKSYAASQSHISKNLLYNPGFEKGKKSWLGAGNVRAHDKHSGRKALAIIGQRSRDVRTFQRISVRPGLTYQFEGWVKAINKKRGKYRFFVSWHSKSGKEIISKRRYFGQSGADNVYAKRIMRFEAPANASTVRLILEAFKADGIGYFDDVKVFVVSQGKIKKTKPKPINVKKQIVSVKQNTNRSQRASTVAQKRMPNDFAAVNDYITVVQNTRSSINITANDKGVNSNTPLQIVTQPKQGDITVGNKGELFYSPKRDYFGSDDFIYQITDSAGNKHFATATISIKCFDACVKTFDITWSASRSPDVREYKIYIGSDANVVDQIYKVMNRTNFKFTARKLGKYYFRVTAINKQRRESNFSSAIIGVF